MGGGGLFCRYWEGRKRPSLLTHHSWTNVSKNKRGEDGRGSAFFFLSTLAADSNQAVEPVPVETMTPLQRTVSRSRVSTPMSKMEGREGSASEKKTFWCVV